MVWCVEAARGKKGGRLGGGWAWCVLGAGGVRWQIDVEIDLIVSVEAALPAPKHP